MITAADFTALKARIKAECARRKYTGSVAEYSGEDYDYTDNEVASGKMVRKEHYTKITIPMTAIDGVTRSDPSLIKQKGLTDLDTALTALEAKKMNATSRANTGCNSSCTGLCYNACGSSCGSNCTGGCGVDCEGACSNTCLGTCQNSCGDACEQACSSSCDWTCYSYCRDDCGGGCTGGCNTTCDAYCEDTCDQGCGDSCYYFSN